MNDIDMELCENCGIYAPAQYISLMSAPDSKMFVCPMCALAIRNHIAGLPADTMFQGSIAKEMFDNFIAWRGENQLCPCDKCKANIPHKYFINVMIMKDNEDAGGLCPDCLVGFIEGIMAEQADEFLQQGTFQELMKDYTIWKEEHETRINP